MKTRIPLEKLFCVVICPGMVALMHKLGTENFVEQFADSPAALSFLEGNFTGDRVTEQNLLLDAVDQSDFTLRQWIDSLMLLGQWLEVRRLSLDLEDQIGYICCSAEAAGAGASMTHLPAMVDDMLNNYGCERASKI